MRVIGKAEPQDLVMSTGVREREELNILEIAACRMMMVSC